jgi:hypothetical protein
MTAVSPAPKSISTALAATGSPGGNRLATIPLSAWRVAAATSRTSDRARHREVVAVVSFGFSPTCHGADYSWRVDTQPSYDFILPFLD